LQRPTPNNPQDLDPDYLSASYAFNELWHMGAQANNNYVTNDAAAFATKI